MLAKLGKTTRRALVVDAVSGSAALVLVAVSADGLDGVTLGVRAEGTGLALSRLGATEADGLRGVGDAPLVNAVTVNTAGVLVASGTVLLDELARATVAVRTTNTLSVAGAVRVVGTSALLGDTLATVTSTRSAVLCLVALRTGLGGGGGSDRGRGGVGDGSAGSVTTRVVVEGGGDVLEDLTVDKATGDGLGHLEGHKGGGGDEESSTDGGTHFEG